MEDVITKYTHAQLLSRPVAEHFMVSAGPKLVPPTLHTQLLAGYKRTMVYAMVHVQCCLCNGACAMLHVQGKVAAAQEALDQAVGISFAIRETAAYATIRAQLLLAQGKDEEAERLLQAAMSMPGVKHQVLPQTRYGVYFLIVMQSVWLRSNFNVASWSVFTLSATFADVWSSKHLMLH